MLHRSRLLIALAIAAVLTVAVMVVVAPPIFATVSGHTHKVIVPEADRFTPFAITIHRGDTVEWVNNDTDDHTVVSDDAFNTTDHKGANRLLVGTTNNNGSPGKVRLSFFHSGTFVYYCRFHAQLDAYNQPIANGAGIPDTPMMGVVTVLP